MKKFFSIFAFIVGLSVLTSSAYAAAPDAFDYSKLNLEGMKIVDKDGFDTFAYLIKIVETPSDALVATLEGESQSKIVSPIFELNQASSFQNIYVYVGQTAEGDFELVRALVNTSGSIFIIDMDITDMTTNEMTCAHGPQNERETLKVQRAVGDLL